MKACKIHIVLFGLIFFIVINNLAFTQLTGGDRIKQGVDTTEQTDDPVERTLEQSQSEDDEAYLHELEQYKQKPINFMSASPYLLSRLPDISIQDARSIVNMRDSTHSTNYDDYTFLSETQISVLKKYTTTKKYSKSKGKQTEPKVGNKVEDDDDRDNEKGDLKIAIRTRYSQDLQNRAGYTGELNRVRITNDSVPKIIDTIGVGTPYLGSQAAVLTRFNAAYKGFYFNAIFEKDAGEPLFYNDSLGYTYYSHEKINDSLARQAEVKKVFGSFVSANASYNLGWCKIILGDFNAEFGQGLVLGGSGGGGKSQEVIKPIYKSTRGLTNYNSAGEFSFLRGGGIYLSDTSSGLSGNLFYSKRQLGASLTDYIIDSLAEVTSFVTDGYHRTHSELRKDDNFTQTLLGGNCKWEYSKAKIELIALKAAYSKPYKADYDYEFSGNSNLAISTNFEFQFNKSLVFAELANSSNKLALLLGTIFKIKEFNAAIHYRNIPAGFHSPKGAVFANKSNEPQNEEGLYCGVSFKPNSKFAFSTYFDLFRSHERTYFVPLPASGFDAAFFVDYRLSSQCIIKAKIREYSKDDGLKIYSPLFGERTIINRKSSYNARLEALCFTKKSEFALRVRGERTYIDYGTAKPPSQGFLTYADLKYMPMQSLQLSSRFSLFNTDSYDASMFEFENDLPGRLVNTGLSGNGSRFYILAKWKPTEDITISGKYSETYYFDRKIISEDSYQQIDAPINNTISLQLDWEF